MIYFVIGYLYFWGLCSALVWFTPKNGEIRSPLIVITATIIWPLMIPYILIGGCLGVLPKTPNVPIDFPEKKFTERYHNAFGKGVEAYVKDEQFSNPYSSQYESEQFEGWREGYLAASHEINAKKATML